MYGDDPNGSDVTVIFASQPSAGTYTIVNTHTATGVSAGQVAILNYIDQTDMDYGSVSGQATVTVVGGKVRVTYQNVQMRVFDGTTTTTTSGNITCN